MLIENYPILKKAPVTEALIDIRVKLPSGFDVKKINQIYESIKNEYPEKQEQKISEVMFVPKTVEIVKSSKPEINGYRYISSNKKKIVQARIDGFTFSRLHPYIQWKELHDEAHRIWKLYKEITSPDSIIRVAVRYINNLKIPLPIKDFGEYLTAPPSVPEGLPQGISGFLTRVVIPDPSRGSVAIIIQALDQIVSDMAPIILDIDVFKLQPDGIKEKDAWEIIEGLRNFKNKVFFSSITDKLKELYK